MSEIYGGIVGHPDWFRSSWYYWGYLELSSDNAYFKAEHYTDQSYSVSLGAYEEVELYSYTFTLDKDSIVFIHVKVVPSVYSGSHEYRLYVDDVERAVVGAAGGRLYTLVELSAGSHTVKITIAETAGSTASATGTLVENYYRAGQKEYVVLCLGASSETNLVAINSNVKLNGIRVAILDITGTVRFYAAKDLLVYSYDYDQSADNDIKTYYSSGYFTSLFRITALVDNAVFIDLPSKYIAGVRVE